MKNLICFQSTKKPHTADIRTELLELNINPKKDSEDIEIPDKKDAMKIKQSRCSSISEQNIDDSKNHPNKVKLTKMNQTKQRLRLDSKRD